MSIQTKEVSSALGALAKAKGQNSYKDIAVAQQPAAVIVENQHTEVPATPKEDLEKAPTTPQNAPEPVDKRDYELAWKELKQHHDKTAYELREEIKQLKSSQAQAAQLPVKPPKTEEEINKFKEQYGEAYDIMRSVIITELQNDTSYKEVRNQIEQVTKAQSELKEKEAFKKLLEEHPDADEIRKDSKFEAWYNEQPDDIKRILAFSTDHRAISKQLSLYKMEVLGVNPKEKKKAESKERVDASLGVDVSSRVEVAPQKKIWTGSEINGLTANHNTWKKHAAEIDLARRENRVDWSK